MSNPTSKTVTDLRYHAPHVTQGGLVMETAADQIDTMASVGIRQEREIQRLRAENGNLRAQYMRLAERPADETSAKLTCAPGTHRYQAGPKCIWCDHILGSPEEPKAGILLYKCGKCGTPMRCGPTQWEYQCECNTENGSAEQT